MRELVAAITYEALFTMVRRRSSRDARRIFFAVMEPNITLAQRTAHEPPSGFSEADASEPSSDGEVIA